MPGIVRPEELYIILEQHTLNHEMDSYMKHSNQKCLDFVHQQSIFESCETGRGTTKRCATGVFLPAWL